jgi:hypothetical protein
LATNYPYGVQLLAQCHPVNIFEPFDPHDKNVRTKHDVSSTKYNESKAYY